MKNLFILFLILILFAGCYAPFSPERGRLEIEKQIGAKLTDSFEFKLDRTTMKLVKSAASKIADEDVTFFGIERIDLAVYELPAGKRVDFRKIERRGWDTLLDKKSKTVDLMILVRRGGKNLSDMVVMAQGNQKVLYGRLKGKISSNIKDALEKTAEEKGIEGLQKKLVLPFKKD